MTRRSIEPGLHASRRAHVGFRLALTGRRAPLFTTDMTSSVDPPATQERKRPAPDGLPSREKISFSFGKNWADFVAANFSDERVDIARRHLLNFLRVPDLEGKYFLDIGSGSGIHSLAALRAGATKIVSFDLDPFSVQTTDFVRKSYGQGSDWTVMHGSVLDQEFLRRLEPADIAYSWGVLHHTGKMWEAIINAATLRKPDGLFYIALYTTDHKSDYWTRVKIRYNAASKLGKRAMESRYLVRHTLLPHLLRLKNPLKTMRDYKKSRGMSYMIDVRDWLGGYPYEHTTPGEMLRFGRDELGLELTNLKTGDACTEYLFAARGR